MAQHQPQNTMAQLNGVYVPRMPARDLDRCKAYLLYDMKVVNHPHAGPVIWAYVYGQGNAKCKVPLPPYFSRRMTQDVFNDIMHEISVNKLPYFICWGQEILGKLILEIVSQFDTQRVTELNLIEHHLNWTDVIYISDEESE